MGSALPTNYDERSAVSERKLTETKNKKGLSPRDREILRLVLLGYSNIEIANRLGIHKVTVSLIRNSAPARFYMGLLQAAKDAKVVALQDQIKADATKIYDQYLDDLTSGEAPINVRLAEARKFLGLAGIVAPTKITGNLTTTFLSAEVLAEVNRRAELAAKGCGLSLPVIEAQFITKDSQEATQPALVPGEEASGGSAADICDYAGVGVDGGEDDLTPPTTGCGVPTETHQKE